MFCPACGIEAPEQLKYCRNCGAGLGAPAAEARTPAVPLRLILLFMTVSLVGVIGIVGLFSTGTDMVRGSAPYDSMMSILILGALVTLLVLGLLSWLLSRMIKLFPPPPPTPAKKPVGERPPVAQMGQPSAIPSVIEHTTRNFERTP